MYGLIVLGPTMMPSIPASYKRAGTIGLVVLGLVYLNYYIFIRPAREVKRKFGGFGKVGYTKLNKGGRYGGDVIGFGDIDPNDPSHAGVPKIDFDPRAALSDSMLSDKFFFPGYNLTKRV